MLHRPSSVPYLRSCTDRLKRPTAEQDGLQKSLRITESSCATSSAQLINYAKTSASKKEQSEPRGREGVWVVMKGFIANYWTGGFLVGFFRNSESRLRAFAILR